MSASVCLVPQALGGWCPFLGVNPKSVQSLRVCRGSQECIPTSMALEASLRRTPGSESLSYLPTVSLLLGEMCRWNLKAGCPGFRPGLNPRLPSPSSLTQGICISGRMVFPGPRMSSVLFGSTPLSQHRAGVWTQQM